MPIQSVKNLELNSKTAKRIAGRVMHDRNMHITSELNPLVRSDYELGLDMKNKLGIIFDDKHLQVTHLQKVGDIWKPVSTKKTSGSSKSVLKRFAKILDDVKAKYNL